MRLSAATRRVEAPLRGVDGQADRGGLERGPEAAAQAAAAIRRFAAEAASGERRAVVGVEDGPGRRGGGAWCRCVRRNASAVIGRRVVLRFAPKSIVFSSFQGVRAAEQLCDPEAQAQNPSEGSSNTYHEYTKLWYSQRSVVRQNKPARTIVGNATEAPKSGSENRRQYRHFRDARPRGYPADHSERSDLPGRPIRATRAPAIRPAPATVFFAQTASPTTNSRRRDAQRTHRDPCGRHACILRVRRLGRA